MKVRVVQDLKGDWFLIPMTLLAEFTAKNDLLSGMDYMENPELFNQYEKDFGHFRTGGNKDNCPLWYKDNFVRIEKI